MALGTLASIALGLSAAGSVSQAMEAKQARKAQQRQMAQQEEEVRAANKLKQTRSDTGADVLLGDIDTKKTATAGSTVAKPVDRVGMNNVGGVKASSRVGL